MGGLVRVETERKVAALTFDDGPDEEWTPKVLEVLARHGVRATFFLVGAVVWGRGVVVDAICEAGHEIGSHGFGHRALPLLDRGEWERDIRLSWQVLIGWLPSPWFRPPYGACNDEIVEYLEATGSEVVLWSYDVSDWSRLIQAGPLASRLGMAKPGDIVLLHDSLYRWHPVRDRRERDVLIEALGVYLGESDLEFVTLSELVKCGEPEYGDGLWVSGEWESELVCR